MKTSKTYTSLIRAVVELDRRLFRAVFGLKWYPASVVLRIFTIIGSAGALWGVFAFFAFVVGVVSSGFSEVWLSRLLVPWGAVAGSWIIAEGTKHLVNRARPFSRFPETAPLIKSPSSSSFPSGHSATASAGAISLSVIYPALIPFFAVTALLVMLSRTYLGVHYPFDVFAGAVIGAVVSTALVVVFL